MEKSNILWLDVDGVLLEWVKPFLEYARALVQYEDLTQYDLSFLFGGDKETTIRAINAFNQTLTYAHLKPLIQPETLQKLKDKGYRLCVITQVDGTLSRYFRVANLARTFGKDMFDNIICVGRGESKVKLLRSYEPMTKIQVVEDNPNFLEEALADGNFSPMAIAHPYNDRELLEIDGQFPIYTDMNELVRHLCAI